MQAAQQDPRWMRIATTTQLPTTSTQVTVSGVYKFTGSSTTYVIVSDSAITVSASATNSALVFSGGYDTEYQYIAAGQYIRSSTSNGTYNLMAST